MKKASLTLGIILGFAVLTASASQLHLKMYDNSGFYVVLNGSYYSGLLHSYNSYSLNPGNHYLQVFVPVYGHRSYPTKRLVFAGDIYIPYNKIINSVIDYDFRFRVISEITENGYYNKPYNNNNGKHYGLYKNGHDYRFPMSNADFNLLLSTLYNAGFESTKMSIAGSAIRSNYFTSRQIRELCKTPVF